ncbi:SixA phosphatase family protein [Kangiella aquimarina]|uniref:Histidine phosphatase family protein n=1 Tax=Kangiella aquimarina TaxID=261965 RepID=A0ABZ0X123_9GAMM|nr:histidine phosphatase family protein [Kangiella aquimarina]WQG84292.1 histidine phosphatase family protein [Kangiella aquimarina]
MAAQQGDFEGEECSSKKLYLFRHGKSDWEARFGSDHERPLAERGRIAAENMGKHLARVKQVPELILCSSSVRTKETLALAMKSGNWQSDVIYCRELYLASVQEAIELIQNQTGSVSKLMVVAHEPMCSSLIAELAMGANVKFPTASVARLSFRAEQWNQINFSKGRLDWLLTPKALFK